MDRFPLPSEFQAHLASGMDSGLHWFPADVPIARLAAVMVGMANTEGGKVLLGLAPRSGQVQGLRDPEEALDLVFQAALLVDPPLVLPIPEIFTFGQLKIMQVLIPSGLPYVYSLDGRYLGREGTQTNPLPARRLRQLLMERGVIQFDTESPPNASFADLDPQKISAYLQALNLPGNESVEEILLYRGCLKSDQKSLKAQGDNLNVLPTYAALLMFGKQPQRWLTSSSILAARFSGSSFADEFIKQEITGTLEAQLYQAEAFVRTHMRKVVRMVGLAREETTEYPLEAVRELLVNAVAHRDYNNQGDQIHLNIFSDRIEIQSPGSLPGPVNLDNILLARFSRNAVIAQLLSDLGFVERLGYGLDRVVQVMQERGLRPPRFEEIAGTFRVTLYGITEPQATLLSPEGYQTYLDMGLNPRQIAALDFLVDHRRITSREYQDLCPDVHTETLRRDLVDLVGRGILIKIGDKRATYYVKKK